MADELLVVVDRLAVAAVPVEVVVGSVVVGVVPMKMLFVGMLDSVLIVSEE